MLLGSRAAQALSRENGPCNSLYTSHTECNKNLTSDDPGLTSLSAKIPGSIPGQIWQVQETKQMSLTESYVCLIDIFTYAASCKSNFL